MQCRNVAPSALAPPLGRKLRWRSVNSGKKDCRNSINLGNASRTVQVDDGAAAKDAILSGVLSGTGGGLTKTGAGTLVLTATSTYTGPTAVNAGTLLVNGNIAASSVVTVAAGATLGGSGTVGAVSVQTGGKLAPGDGVGTLTTGNLTLADNAEILCEFSGANSADQLVVSGLTLGANTVLRLLDAGITQTPRGKFVLIQYSGADPALGTWTVYSSVPGAPAADVQVYQDTANHRIMLQVGRPQGSMFVVR